MDFSRQSATSTFLVDNGSLQPESVLRLRQTAWRLSQRVGVRIEPVSMLYSSGIDPAKLDNVPAEILEPAIRRRVRSGVRDIQVVPLFFGPSAALIEYIPQRTARIAAEFPDLRVVMAGPLVDVSDSDDRLARALSDRVLEAMSAAGAKNPRVILVDHGSPRPEVAAVRDHVAGQLAQVLGSRVGSVRAASMERRPGEEYAFNEPLLENALLDALHAQPSCPVIVSLMFFAPGRHAGPGGDIEQICRRCTEQDSRFRIHIAGVLGDHPALIEILADRYQTVTEQAERSRQTND